MQLPRRGVLRAGAGLLGAGSATFGRIRAGSRSRRRSTPTATPGDYEPLGSVPLDGLTEAVVGSGGRYVFCAVTTGFAVVDVGAPSSPEVVVERRDVLADRENGPLHGIQDVKVDGNRLVVAGPAHPGQGALRAVVLYDVSDPAAPRRLRVAETDHYHHNVFLDGDRVYLTGNDGEGNPVVILDGDLDELGQWSLADADERWLDVDPRVKVLHDLWVQGDTAYLAYWDAGTWAVDVSDPTVPTVLAKVRGRPPGAFADLSMAAAADESLALPGNNHYVTVDESGTLLGIGSEAWDQNPDDGVDEGPGGIELFDVSDPTAPSPLVTVAPPSTADPSLGGVWTTAHNFELAGDRLYSSWYRGGVRVFDLADPANPRLLRAWRDDASTSFWTARAARPGELFVASSRHDPRDRSGPGRLYAFADAPPGTPPPTSTPRPATSTTATASTTTRTTGPGFGVLATIGAVGGLAAWRALGRANDRERAGDEDDGNR